MLHKIRSLPHILLFKRSPIKLTIEQDISRGIQFTTPNRQGAPTADNLRWLLQVENNEEFRNLFYYRIESRSKLADKLLLFLAKRLYKPLSHLRIVTPVIGPGLAIKHGYGSVIQAERIGKNCLIFQEVVIGFKDDGKGAPILGDHVHIGAGAKVLGPVTIGDYSDIAANAVVVCDVPPNCTVGGVPARIIKTVGNQGR